LVRLEACPTTRTVPPRFLYRVTAERRVARSPARISEEPFPKYTVPSRADAGAANRALARGGATIGGRAADPGPGARRAGSRVGRIAGGDVVTVAADWLRACSTNICTPPVLEFGDGGDATAVEAGRAGAGAGTAWRGGAGATATGACGRANVLPIERRGAVRGTWELLCAPGRGVMTGAGGTLGPGTATERLCPGPRAAWRAWARSAIRPRSVRRLVSKSPTSRGRWGTEARFGVGSPTRPNRGRSSRRLGTVTKQLAEHPSPRACAKPIAVAALDLSCQFDWLRTSWPCPLNRCDTGMFVAA
jgi:hypothetical protein